MARGEEYKSQDGVFIGQDPNFGKNLQTSGALPTRRRVGDAPEALYESPKVWVLDLVNT